MAQKKTFSYEEAVSEIEEILAEIESGNMDVDALSGKVERAMLLIKKCQDKLRKTENKVSAFFTSDEENREKNE